MEDELKELLDLLKSDPEKAIAIIKTNTKEQDKIQDYIKEYRDQDRTQRDGQVGTVQKDKSLADNKLVKMVKIYINHAQNIVETLAAFVVGKPVTLVPSEDNNLAGLIKQIWRVNRMDSKLLKAMIVRMSETQVALNFYINDIESTSILNKILVKLGLAPQAKEIKVKILDNKKGVMTPYMSTSGDMQLFMWQFQTKSDSKTINHTEIWDAENKYYINDETGTTSFVSSDPHGFDRIPMVYDEQFEPQWYTTKSPIDRHEVALSKLGDSNDYSGHPILVTEGEVNALPGKEQSGKHINIPIKYDEDGNEIKGKVSFLESEFAPESNKLELDKLEDAIAYGSSVPNLSLDKLKDLGNVAEKTVKLMFLATELKAELIRTDTRTFIERCINVIIGGITTTTNKALIKEAQMLYYDIHFNSILPSDIAERVKTVSEAVESGVMSKETGIGIIDLVSDVKDEMDKIASEKEANTEEEQE